MSYSEADYYEVLSEFDPVTAFWSIKLKIEEAQEKLKEKNQNHGLLSIITFHLGLEVPIITFSKYFKEEINEVITPQEKITSSWRGLGFYLEALYKETDYETYLT